MSKLSAFIFALSLFANTDKAHAESLRGRKLNGSSTPTCEEVHNYEFNGNSDALFCTEECGTEYWLCVNGEVITAPMPGGTYCHNGGFAEFGVCNERDDRCDEIEALNLEDKIKCTEDCSDNYLACSNGRVIEMPMAEGTKCYRDGIVRTAAGHCVVQEEVITYFELMDACMNYPDLEHCASTADPSSPPYNGAEFNDGAWYFTDKVWFSYVSTYSEEYQWSDEHGWYNGKGWDVFINIHFGHDLEPGRSRSIIASMDYGTTQIYKWSQYDLVDGDEDDAHYNCKTAIPDEPVTHFIEQLIKNPAIIFGLGEGKFDIPDDDEVHDYTAQVSIPASELGDMEGVEGNVTVLVESQDAAEEEVDEGAEPIVTPTFLFKNVIVYDKDFFDEDPTDIEQGYGDDNEYDDDDDVDEEIEDDGSDMPTIETMDEIRKLFDGYFNVTLNQTVCSEDFEQVFTNDTETDIAVPILNRGKLTAGTGETSDIDEEIIEDGTEELSDQIDPIARRLLKVTKKQEKFLIPQENIYDCVDGQVLVYHCCSEDPHFLSCSPKTTENCPAGAVSSSRCVESNAVKDVILEPRFLKQNIPMQLHTADHLESLNYELENLLTEETLSELFQSDRKLYWDSDDQNEWVAQEEEDFTSEENFLPKTRGKINNWVSSPVFNGTEVTREDLWDNYGDVFLGRGGGLPNVQDLLHELTEIDETLGGFYDISTTLEGDMLSIFELMHNVDKAEEQLKDIDRTLSTLERVLKLISIIRYVKPIATPIRNSVAKIRNSGIKRALSMVQKIRGKVTQPHKGKVKKALTKNEEIRSVLAKSRFLNQNLMINPFETTRNCEPTDKAAEFLVPLVREANFDTTGALDEIKQFQEAFGGLKKELKGVINLVEDMTDSIEKVIDKANPIKKVMDPFYTALSTRITIPIFGPFCRKTVTIKVPYPCGIKKCRKCRRIFRKKRCIKYPCGIKRCSFTRRVQVPVFCKKTFSFTVNQVLNGISGAMDYIFYPINKATDELLKAIPLPDIPLLPAFPTDFGAMEKMSIINNVIAGPNFPSNLLDVPSVQLALPGLDEALLCGRSANDLAEVIDMALNKEITPEFVREFYNDCGGWQDLNPVCGTTEELLCGDGGCPTESPTNFPTNAPTSSPTNSPTTAAPTSSPTVSASVSPSFSPSSSPTFNASSAAPSANNVAESVGEEEIADDIDEQVENIAESVGEEEIADAIDEQVENIGEEIADDIDDIDEQVENIGEEIANDINDIDDIDEIPNDIAKEVENIAEDIADNNSDDIEDIVKDADKEVDQEIKEIEKEVAQEVVQEDIDENVAENINENVDSSIEIPIVDGTEGPSAAPSIGFESANILV